MGQSFKGHHKSLSSKIKFIQCKESEKKGHLWYLLCNSQPNCIKNGYLSVKQLTTSIVPKSKISFLSLIFSTIYYTRCHKVLETINISHVLGNENFSLVVSCLRQNMSIVVLMTSIVTVSLKLISNNIFTYMCLKWKIIGLFHLLGMRSSRGGGGGRKVLETRIYSTV